MAETAVHGRSSSTFVDASASTEEPGEPQILLQQAIFWQSKNDFPQALKTLEQAILQYPLETSLWVAVADLLQELGDLASALECLRQALLLDGENVDARVVLGNMQRQQGDIDAARRHYEYAVEHRPDHVVALTNLASLLSDQGSLDRSLGLLRQASQAAPESALVAFNYGNALLTAGHLEQAREKYLAAFNRHPRPAKVLHNLVTTFKAQPGDRPMLDLWYEHAAAKSSTDEDRANLAFAQGKVADDLQDYDLAFEHFRQANALVPVTFDAELNCARTDETIQVWSEKFLNARMKWGNSSSAPIFIVGMPRSGTTLVEQILSAHSQVQALGERQTLGQAIDALTTSLGCDEDDNLAASRSTQSDFHEIADEYLTIPNRDDTRPVFTDKMPMNFRHLGWIAACFPDAKIIHCVRDIRDVCLSCYFQHFTSRLPFSYRLEDLVAYSQDYLRLMNHWQSVLPGRILNVTYEHLVQSPESEIKRLLSACELQDEAACFAPHQSARPVGTASAWQVKQPIYRSSRRRWENYREHVTCLLDAFGTN